MKENLINAVQCSDKAVSRSENKKTCLWSLTLKINLKDYLQHITLSFLHHHHCIFHFLLYDFVHAKENFHYIRLEIFNVWWTSSVNFFYLVIYDFSYVFQALKVITKKKKKKKKCSVYGRHTIVRLTNNFIFKNFFRCLKHGKWFILWRFLNKRSLFLAFFIAHRKRKEEKIAMQVIKM